MTEKERAMNEELEEEIWRYTVWLSNWYHQQWWENWLKERYGPTS
jgi:hypothetical protein